MSYLIEQTSRGTYNIPPQLVAEAVLRRWRAELAAFSPTSRAVAALDLDGLQSPPS